MRTSSNISYVSKQLWICLLASGSNTSSQKAHTLLVLLTAELLPWLSAALECHQQSCAEQTVPSSHPTHKPTLKLYLHRECHSTRVFSVLLSHHTTQILLMHKGLATTSGEGKERPHNTAELTSTEKRKCSQLLLHNMESRGTIR